MELKLVHARTVAVTAAMVTALAGCGSSVGTPAQKPFTATTGGAVSTAASPPSTGPSTGGATTASATGDAFCTPLGDYARKFKSISLSGKLDAVKKELPPLIDSGKSAAGGAPAEIKGDVTALVADISALNDWIQTKATQKALDSSSVPPEVAKPFADLSKRLPKLQTWFKAHCKGTFGS